MWKVSWLYEKVHNIANFGGYAAILYLCQKQPSCKKKGEAKNAHVHVHGVTITKRHDSKIWPRKHLQYRHFYAFIFYMLRIITSN